jgi:mono/diheme cytochrome c family protein
MRRAIAATMLVLGGCSPSASNYVPDPGSRPFGPEDVRVSLDAQTRPGGGTPTARAGTCSDTIPAVTPSAFGSSLRMPEVAAPATPPPAISGGTLLALSDGATAVASDPDRDRVYVVDLAHNAVRATIELAPGDEPGRLVEDAAGRVHVALRRGGAVVAIDPAAGAVLGTRAVCAAPRGLAYDARADLVHVACASGELVSLPAAGGPIARTVTLERDLRDVVVAGDHLVVSTFRRADVLVLDGGGAVSRRLAPAAGARQTRSFGLRTVTPEVAWRMIPTSRLSGRAAGGVALLHQTAFADPIDDTVKGSTPPTYYGGGDGCDAVVSAGVTVLVPGGEEVRVAPALASVSLAVDLAVSPDGRHAAFAVAGNAYARTSSVVSVSMDYITGAGEAEPGGCLPSGTPMQGNVVGEVVAVSYRPDGVLLAQTREPAALWRSDSETPISLATESRFDTGHALFHANAGSGVACASCHPEGGEDGHVWRFACQGPRRTQSIRGGLRGTEPFHWDGRDVDFARLVDDVFVGRMRGPQLRVDQREALFAWVDALPALPVVAPADADAVARGQALFADASVGCATCHATSRFTNNLTVDVGTGRPLQVPSLRGVSWRAPFMHDGCAATLADRFSPGCGGGDKHGATSALTAAQRADLVSYLDSL